MANSKTEFESQMKVAHPIEELAGRNELTDWRRPGLVVLALLTVFVLQESFWNARVWAQGTPAGAVAPAKPLPAAGAADDTFFEIVFSGGFMGITIMVLLILLSVVAVYLVVDQAMALRKKELVPADVVENVRQLLSQGKLKEADQMCRERPCPLTFVLVSGISEIEYGWPAVEKALEDSTAEQAARLYRKLEYLSVIGNIAPMLGLLGTVTGMILAFRQVALSQGTAGAGDLAAGIYSALVTTVAGLIIAIPSLAAFAIFRNKIDEIISDTAYSAQHVFGSVRRRIPGSTAVRPSIPQPPRN
jgi:biopolymer transport protein ExbB